MREQKEHKIERFCRESEKGLDSEQVKRSFEEHGGNEIGGYAVRGFFSRMLDELKNPVTKILLLALLANICMIFYGGSIAETVGIGISIIISVVVAVLSEIGSDRAFAQMCKTEDATVCSVIRGGEVASVPVSELVVGDTVLLSPGDRIPADGILITGTITVELSALNGESREWKKVPASRDDTQSCDKDELTDPSSLFRGAMVTSGSGKMQILRVGESTLYGSTARELSADSQPSPLKNKLTKLSRQISMVGIIGAVAVFAARFIPAVLRDGFTLSALFRSLMLSVSLLVVAVPEGLPMMITVVLCSNMKKMSRAGVLVRKLVGIETAGNIDILFCDKTGTLTRGKMNVSAFITADGGQYRSFSSLPDRLKRLCAASFTLNSVANFTTAGISGGNATERAVMSFAGRGAAALTSSVRVCEKLPFDSRVRYSSARVEGGIDAVLFKGAPEVILPMCNCMIDPSGGIRHTAPGKRIYDIIDECTESGARMLAFAVSRDSHTAFIGLARIEDLPRREARGCVERLKRAGVRVVMVTGDDPRTAACIAGQCGIGNGEHAVTGAQLAEMSDDEVTALLPELSVVARALPRDKSRLVRLAREAGRIPAMTGDGVNDAPALRAADVGFAMGSGSELAKQAGDIVILDDNIASIERAVLYGRTILSSIRKFIVFQLTMNFCAMFLCIAAPIFGIETPVTVTQMLWMNLIMDSLGGLAFAGEPSLMMYMHRPPAKRSESIITKSMTAQIAAMTVWSLICMALYLRSGRFCTIFPTKREFLCGFFNVFVLCGVANAFCARAPRLNFFAGLKKNRAFIFIMAAVCLAQAVIVSFGGDVFRCVRLDLSQWRSCIALAFCVIPPEFLRRFILRLTPQKNK